MSCCLSLADSSPNRRFTLLASLLYKVFPDVRLRCVSPLGLAEVDGILTRDRPGFKTNSGETLWHALGAVLLCQECRLIRWCNEHSLVAALERNKENTRDRTPSSCDVFVGMPGVGCLLV